MNLTIGTFALEMTWMFSARFARRKTAASVCRTDTLFCFSIEGETMTRSISLPTTQSSVLESVSECTPAKQR